MYIAMTGSREKKRHLKFDLILKIPTYLEIGNFFLLLFIFTQVGRYMD